MCMRICKEPYTIGVSLRPDYVAYPKWTIPVNPGTMMLPGLVL